MLYSESLSCCSCLDCLSSTFEDVKQSKQRRSYRYRCRYQASPICLYRHELFNALRLLEQARKLGGVRGEVGRTARSAVKVHFRSNVLYTDACSTQKNAPLNLYALLLWQILSIVFMQSVHFSLFLYNMFLIVVFTYLKKSAPCLDAAVWLLFLM